MAQIAPQQSTPYAGLANAPAPAGLELSPLGERIAAIEPLELGGQAYLRLELRGEPGADRRRELGMLAMTSAFFEYHECLGEHAGPFLRPTKAGFEPRFRPELVVARRYKGKTNELLTHFLCNVARFSSAFRRQPWAELRVFDPLAGGGTTLFTALVLGAEAAGVEKSARDVEITASFLRQYAREQGIACRVRSERLRKLGRRWWFTLGKQSPRRCLPASGETPSRWR